MTEVISAAHSCNSLLTEGTWEVRRILEQQYWPRWCAAVGNREMKKALVLCWVGGGEGGFASRICEDKRLLVKALHSSG